MVFLLFSSILLLTSVTLVRPADIPYVWLGNSPFCTASQSDCDYFDLDYVNSSTTGDGQKCLTGIKVQCQMRPLAKQRLHRHPRSLVASKHEIGNHNLLSTSHNQFTVLSYNIFQRPFVVSHDGQFVRTCHIARTVLNHLPDLDAMVFEEAFLEGCFQGMSLRQMLAFYGFPYSTPTVGHIDKRHQPQVGKPRHHHHHDHKRHAQSASKGLTLTNGGVFIASRWPIVANTSIVYTNTCASTADEIARKGAVYAKIVKTVAPLRGGEAQSQTYHLFGTHLQAQFGEAEDDVRYKQAGELEHFMRQIIAPPADEPVLFVGDFNTDNISQPDQVLRIRRKLGAAVPPLTAASLNATYDPTLNDVVEPGNVPQWIDYAMFSELHQRPVEASLEALLMPTAEPIVYCAEAPLCPFFVYPQSPLCRGLHSTHFLSDHFPIVGRFTF